ncbi:hypothetical protein EV356DRAFT_120428 [Viridothelium virens]|uniref:S-adenosyl-L-methionine-dependent methyltransferase n=1 Tax=Viridothelium virens TaxID=1048519 RepID=A0A6A6HCE4_VIRVR|nr:hypothetical protein EV356DRAFT_120428 [Viridothelium virens]
MQQQSDLWNSLLSTVRLKKRPGDSKYVLRRDYAASSRLNLQFFLWKDLLRFNLHPDIAKTLNPHARIADVATGTSIWLVDLARELPLTTELYGFDVDLTQSPPAESLPSHLHLATWDMFTPPPKDLVSTFDVVHLRLVTLVIKNSDPTTLIANVARLLKPGGYMQWDEIDTEGLYIDAPDAVEAEAVSKLFRATKIPKGTRGRDDWKWNLGSFLSRQGFMQSDLFTYKYEGAASRFWHDMYLVSWEEFITRVVGGIKQNRELINNAVEETRKGVHVIYPKLVWVARKDEVEQGEDNKTQKEADFC